MKKTLLLIPLALFFLLVNCGCDMMAFTDTGYVKAKARKYSQALTAQKFSEAKEFHAEKFTWQQGPRGRKYNGPAGGDAFIKSLQDGIPNMDGVYIYVHEAKKLSKDKVQLNITMQAHKVIDSMSMIYGNTCWKAKMLWVKTGSAKWQIAYIQEVTPRADIDPPADITPL